jgi:hypothetical protein
MVVNGVSRDRCLESVTFYIQVSSEFTGHTLILTYPHSDTVEVEVEKRKQANYINALAVSVSPLFEPAKVTLAGLIFSPWVDFLMTLGGFLGGFGELLKFVR